METLSNCIPSQISIPDLNMFLLCVIIPCPFSCGISIASQNSLMLSKVILPSFQKVDLICFLPLMKHRYRWLFLRKEQKWHPNITFQNLKSLVSLIKSIKSKYFKAFLVQISASCHTLEKESYCFYGFDWRNHGSYIGWYSLTDFPAKSIWMLGWFGSSAA